MWKFLAELGCELGSAYFKIDRAMEEERRKEERDRIRIENEVSRQLGLREQKRIQYDAQLKRQLAKDMKTFSRNGR